MHLDVWDPMRPREVWGLHSYEAPGSHLCVGLLPENDLVCKFSSQSPSFSLEQR